MRPDLEFMKKHLKIDPLTGRKIKPVFDQRARIIMVQKLTRMYSPELNALGLDSKGVEKMIDDIKGGFRNSRMYYQQYYSDKPHVSFIRVFSWISKELGTFK